MEGFEKKISQNAVQSKLKVRFFTQKNGRFWTIKQRFFMEKNQND